MLRNTKNSYICVSQASVAGISCKNRESQKEGRERCGTKYIQGGTAGGHRNPHVRNCLSELTSGVEKLLSSRRGIMSECPEPSVPGNTQFSPGVWGASRRLVAQRLPRQQGFLAQGIHGNEIAQVLTGLDDLHPAGT